MIRLKHEKPGTWFVKARAFTGELFVTALIFLVVITFVMQSYAVEGSSMQPTLESGDRLIAEKVSYRFGSIDQGDIVVLYYPADPSKTFIKRVIARPGDTIAFKEGTPVVNGATLSEAFVSPLFRSHESRRSMVVPPGYYFVMGDHRNVSYDSRHFGFVPEKYILARAVVRFWPLNKIGLIGW
ncbi:signal peptidase I [bacterium]|nr:signal peptidase I [bacterium]